MSRFEMTESQIAEHQARVKAGRNTAVVTPGTKTRFIIPGAPVSKPRQTQSDKWKKRPCVVAYREWADTARASCAAIAPNVFQMMAYFYLPFPPSYSQSKRDGMAGSLHYLKPDIDNLVKALLDAIFPNDSHIAIVHAYKRWDDGNGPRVEVEFH